MNLRKESSMRQRAAIATAIPLLLLATAGAAGAGPNPSTEVIKGSGTTEVLLHRTQPGCTGTSLDISSGRVEDPTPNLVSTVVVDVDANCNVSISEQTSRIPITSAPVSAGATESLSTAGVAIPSTARTSDFEANTIYGNYVRSSQTLQDIINIDIAKWKWTHDRQWDTVTLKTRFKAASTCSTLCWGQASTSVWWNHPVSANFATADTAWKTGTASSIGYGEFHSDFLWCNLEAGQNFRLTTEVKSWNPGGYDAKFTQSKTCSGTHMATSKWTSTALPPY